MVELHPLDNLSIVLVEPQSPGNIGMTCRAMANFGATDLRLVNPCPHLHPEARKFAVGAAHLLEAAKIFSDLPAALADLHISLATTRRGGRQRGALYDLGEAPALRTGLPPNGRIGLVFGREDAGLTSAEIAACSHAATVATTSPAGSLNLAQAVLLFLHEFARRPTAPPAARELPAQEEFAALFAQMETVLARIAFLNPKRPQRAMATLRRIHHRATLDRGELDLLRGMWSQIAWSVRDWRGRKRGED